MFKLPIRQTLIVAFLAFPYFGQSQTVKPDQIIKYCTLQAQKTLNEIPQGPRNLPRSIEKTQKQWRYTDYRDWCSGFWPGILWYLFEDTKDTKWRTAAEQYTAELAPLVSSTGFDHDLGFMIYNSYGNGYRLTRNPAYKSIILAAADSLATLYNPKVGTILSWPGMVKQQNWPHNTIIDNMMNLELLFWAAKNGGNHRLYDIAVRHANTTMQNHFRPDFSAYHVVVYDTLSGKKIKGVTHQGLADNSMWARGQSWAIYGYTMCYRETRKPEYLKFAQQVADVYLKKLPANGIPFWDFNAPITPATPKDASAACITSSALLELSTLVKNKTKAAYYRKQAERMLAALSHDWYLAKDQNPSFLLHSTGHLPKGSEIDASIIYADYYFLEAMIRLQKLRAHLPLIKQ
jgi:unsaturated chondroitin disaccharide hydrolase